MLRTINLYTKKTIFVLSLIMSFMFVVPPAANAASALEILLVGVVQYKYLETTLRSYNYNQKDQILADYKKKYGVSDDETANEQLDKSMNRLLEVIKKNEEVKPEYSWFVNKEESFNAFCGLGHNISVNIGLFKYLNYNEDQLAFVLAHEIVHGQKDHSLNSIKKTVPISVVQALYMSKNPTQTSYILSAIAANSVVANYSTLPVEKEADRLSYDYAVDAGYNPGAGAAIWARVLAKSGNNASSGFEKIVNPNDHPSNLQRVEYFAGRMSAYANNKVTVQNKTVYIHGSQWITPLADGDVLAEERTYLIAGNLASVFHTYPEGKRAYAENGSLKMDDRIIMCPAEGDLSAGELAASLNAILGF